MKRETLKFVKAATNRNALPEGIGEDILATDAEVKRLRKALREIVRGDAVIVGYAERLARAALKPQVTRERKRR